MYYESNLVKDMSASNFTIHKGHVKFPFYDNVLVFVIKNHPLKKKYSYFFCIGCNIAHPSSFRLSIQLKTHLIYFPFNKKRNIFLQFIKFLRFFIYLFYFFWTSHRPICHKKVSRSWLNFIFFYFLWMRKKESYFLRY